MIEIRIIIVYNGYMDKYIVTIGGGELRTKETLEIDRYIANLAKLKAGDKRAVALFIGTASHDSMPYYYTFHKTYTGELGLKTDCALTVYGEMNEEKIKSKFEKADMIYVGGGNTLYMLEHWKKCGLLDLIKQAYERGVILSGLSAGAICWFENMFTDGFISNGESSEYEFSTALGYLKGGACPHYNERRTDFFNKVSSIKDGEWFAIENNSAIVFKNGEMFKTLSSGGKSYKITLENGKTVENLIV